MNYIFALGILMCVCFNDRKYSYFTNDNKTEAQKNVIYSYITVRTIFNGLLFAFFSQLSVYL